MITLELEIQEVNTILSGLGKLPAEMSMELILKIRAEAERQLKELEDSQEIVCVIKKTTPLPPAPLFALLE